MRPAAPEAEDEATHWHGSLDLHFVRDGVGTRLGSCLHRGPLRVQKALHPEGAAVCQVVILHPPSGIAGGDTLDVAIDVGPAAHAQLITPGATRWYRSAGLDARQSMVARVGDGGALEWLPHEAIVFDRARARMQTRLELAGSAVAIASDVVCLGRVASGETFAAGHVRQRFELVRDGALVWAERNVLDAQDAVRWANIGLGGRHAFGMLLVAAPAIPGKWISAARDVGSDLAIGDAAVTHVPGALLARCRSDSATTAVDWLRRVWIALRPLVLTRPAVLPRLWAT
ncbi:MAG: urease accessory protein UreD [Casimicrobiaceae bacterium]